MGNYSSTPQCGSYYTEHEEKIFIGKMKQFDDGGDTKTVNLNEEPEVSSRLDIRLSEQAEKRRGNEGRFSIAECGQHMDESIRLLSLICDCCIHHKKLERRRDDVKEKEWG